MSEGHVVSAWDLFFLILFGTGASQEATEIGHREVSRIRRPGKVIKY